MALALTVLGPSEYDKLVDDDELRTMSWSLRDTRSSDAGGHGQKAIDKLFLLKVLLSNADPHLRLAPSALATIDRMLLKVMSVSSYLEKVYKKHLEICYNNVDVYLADAEPWHRMFAHLIGRLNLSRRFGKRKPSSRVTVEANSKLV